MNKRKKGTTLIELLIASAVFSILVICLFAIIRYATKNWRSVEDRASIQSEIRNIETNLSGELKKTSYASVVTWTDDYRHTLGFKSFTNPITGKFDTDATGNPLTHGYILYILLRPMATEDLCTHSAILGTDNKCPHKFLLRVDLTRTTDGASSWDPWPGLPPDDIPSDVEIEEYIPPHASLSGKSVSRDQYIAAVSAQGADSKYVQNVYIVGKNLLSFNVSKMAPPDNPEILVDIKCLKELEATQFLKVGSDDLDASQFTIQVDNRIIPQNP
ncbi:MAG: type II secretion system GspH family protein [Candidatus Eremiobacteraeota bacterium]|nr:type II secretion system GspH family protein [Candidatus Eremiobacteraeota bacterium]